MNQEKLLKQNKILKIVIITLIFLLFLFIINILKLSCFNSKNIKHIKNDLKNINCDYDIFEIRDCNNKSLEINIYLSSIDDLYWREDKISSNLGEIIKDFKKYEWFKYKYIYTNIYVSEIGIIMTNISDMTETNAKLYDNHLWISPEDIKEKLNK